MLHCRYFNCQVLCRFHLLLLPELAAGLSCISLYIYKHLIVMLISAIFDTYWVSAIIVKCLKWERERERSVDCIGDQNRAACDWLFDLASCQPPGQHFDANIQSQTHYIRTLIHTVHCLFACDVSIFLCTCIRILYDCVCGCKEGCMASLLKCVVCELKPSH